MNPAQLRKLSTDVLVTRFVAIALEQEQLILPGDVPKTNRLYPLMDDVRNELKIRDGDHRHELLPLYQHSNFQVRLKAAKSTLALAPEQGRRVLEEIARSKHYPQAGEAGMSLWALDKGIFKPT